MKQVTLSFAKWASIGAWVLAPNYNMGVSTQKSTDPKKDLGPLPCNWQADCYIVYCC